MQFCPCIGTGMGSSLRLVFALTAVAVLAAAGAVVGGTVGGIGGGIAGAVLGAMAGVVAGYVPGIRNTAMQRAAGREAARARLRAAGEPTYDGDQRGPSLLLRPDRGVVAFTGRDIELAELRSWCESPEDKSIRLVTGSGGVGKTRLALKLAAEWQASGRQGLMVAAGMEADAMAAARGVTTGPVLLVVDYAETRSALGDLLRAVLDDQSRVRVLLLARAVGEWWDRLAEESASAVARLLSDASEIRLDAPITGELSDAQVAAAAVPFFARELEVEVPASVVFELPTDRRVPVLVLHAAALLAVLRPADGGTTPRRVAATGQVLAELLEHEARYWRRAATREGLPTDGRVLKAVVAAAILLGADGLAEAAAVARRVPDLCGKADGDLRAWARWLYGLYPASPDGRLGTLQPDLVAEAHAVGQLAAHSDLAWACLRDIGQEQAGRALTVLARAWDLHIEAGRLISTALRDNLPGLAVAAAGVALQTTARVGGPLADALEDAPAPLEALISIERTLPYPSVALARADAAVSMRIFRELPSESDSQTVALWAFTAGLMLSQAGRPAHGLPLTQEAVAAYRKLAATDPDQFLANLATAVSRLGMTLSELGRPADALPVAEEAVLFYRVLAAADRGRYRAELAAALTNLGIDFSKMGRLKEALAATEEAVVAYRELATTDKGRYRAELAAALSNLGNRLGELRRPADALAVSEEAVVAYRDLAAAHPDRYRADLAAALSNLGIRLGALGGRAGALAAEREALTIRRDLTATNPDRYRADLANSLLNLGFTFSELGRPADALPVTEEAVAIRREMAATDPDRYRAELAAALSRLAITFSELGRPADALPVTEESVAIRRELAAADPGTASASPPP
jgi:hypothetical protein